MGKESMACVAAQKIGITADEWLEKQEKGLKWCYCCRYWLSKKRFGTDNSRSSKLASACKSCTSYKGTASRYNITVKDARVLRSGSLHCELCGRKKKLEVDHDHKTDEIRGMLCSRCNSAIGLFHDDVSLLRKAIEYLDKKEVSEHG